MLGFVTCGVHYEPIYHKQIKFVHDTLTIHNLQLARKCTIQNLLEQTFGFVNNTICNHRNDYVEPKKVTQYEKLSNDQVMT